MKRAVSISLGSSKRDKAVEVELLGERVSIERIGTDGDMEAAAQKYKELDGKVDAFGVGGADLGLMVAEKWYPLYSVNKMVRFVKQTPIVDGTGLKNTLERRVVGFMQQHIPAHLEPKKVMLTGGADRWGMTQSFLQGGFETVFCDLMFALDVPIPLRSEAAVLRLTKRDLVLVAIAEAGGLAELADLLLETRLALRLQLRLRGPVLRARRQVHPVVRAGLPGVL